MVGLVSVDVSVEVWSVIGGLEVVVWLCWSLVGAEGMLDLGTELPNRSMTDPFCVTTCEAYDLT